MKTAASVFSWLIGIVRMIFDIFYLPLALASATLIKQLLPNSDILTVGTDSLSSFFWIVTFISFISKIVILIWRQVSVASGHKVGSGIFTLLFVTLIGGILTLCIPENELNNNQYSPYNVTNNINIPADNKQISIKNTEDDIIKLLTSYKKMFDDGVITQEEFEKKKAELLEKI